MKINGAAQLNEDIVKHTNITGNFNFTWHRAVAFII